MIIYTALTSYISKIFATNHECEIGWMISASDNRNPPKDIRWALDNGAWTYYNKGIPFDEAQFFKALDRIPLENPPDFIILPDVVCGFYGSILYSNSWYDRICGLNYPYYLSVQDGIEPGDLGKWIECYSGIFVGGSKKWKLKTLEMWSNYAHDLGINCRVGRISSVPHLLLCKRLGIDSIDSVTFVRKPKKLKRITDYNFQQQLTIDISEM